VPLRLCEVIPLKDKLKKIFFFALSKECFNALHPVENIRAYEHNRHSGHGSVWGTLYERVMVEAVNLSKLLENVK